MPKIPSPHDCGLPEKFDSWRANQQHAIGVIITSDKRITGLSAPTGFGKSPVYVAAALLSKQPTCIVTNSKGLQDQLLKDYGSIGMVDIRGRSNYACDMRDDYSCLEGKQARCPYNGTVHCPASLAEMKAAASRLVVTNYDKWTSAGGFGMGLSHFTQVVFDEGHDAPDAIARAMQLEISHDDVEKLLKVEYPIDVELFGYWKGWATVNKPVADELLVEQRSKIMGAASPKSSWIKEFHHIRETIRKMNILSSARPEDWVVEGNQYGFTFDPIRPARYAESTLLLRLPRIIVVSATLRPKTMYMLGLGRQTFDFYEFDSDFDRSRCPVYWVPTMRVDSRAKDLSLLWTRLDQIMARRRDRKGIIHTISYARRDEVMSGSRFRDSMITNQRGESITALIEAFRQSDPGTVLVSPTVSTGYDFPYKDAEWQFITKIPFPDGRSKINKARQADDKEYGAYSAMQTLVQMAGRIMRAKDDVGETFMADDHLAWFIPRYRHLAPSSFHSFFRVTNTLPQPPEALP